MAPPDYMLTGLHAFFSAALLLRAFLPRDFCALLSRFGQANRDRLLATLDRAALSALAALQRSLLAAAHRAFDAFARGFAVLPAARSFLSTTRFLCRHVPSA